MKQLTTVVWTLSVSMTLGTAAGGELQHGFVDSAGVKLHYVTTGDGPLAVLVHGFPDYWYTWRAQMPALAKHFQVVAIDLRGYNKSDKPKGVLNYALPILAADIKHVVEHFEKDRAIVIGHDWGGYIAWTCAMTYPDMVEKLIVLNAPHPAGLMRELRDNPRQQANSQYARDFQQPAAASQLTAGKLAGWVRDEEARRKYVEAFERSSFEAMLNYYKANYPRASTDATSAEATPAFPKIQCPTMIIHGRDDPALLAAGLNDNWDYANNELTIVTIPGASHFVQQDAAELVTQRIVDWLVD